MAAIGHETNKEFNRNAFNLIQAAVTYGLTNSQVAAADTIAGLKTALAAVGAASNQNGANLMRHAQSAIQAATDAGIIANSDILSLTTTAGLLAVFSNLDSELSTARQISLAYSPRTGSL